MPFNPLQGPPPSPPEAQGIPPTETGMGIPSMPPADPNMQVPQDVSPEERQILLDLIEKIKANLGNLRAQDFAGKNSVEMTRRTLLRQAFEKLQLAGVDLTDRESVAAFIANLREQNPTLADQFEQAMAVLLGAADGGGFATPSVPGEDPMMGGDPMAGMQDPNMNMNNPNTNEAISQG